MVCQFMTERQAMLLARDVFAQSRSITPRKAIDLVADGNHELADEVERRLDRVARQIGDEDALSLEDHATALKAFDTLLEITR